MAAIPSIQSLHSFPIASTHLLSMNSCAAQASGPCVPLPTHPTLVPTAPGGGSAWGFVLSPPEQGLSSQYPIPASPACCKTLNKLSCFSKLCSPHLQNEGPTLPVEVQ